MKGKFKENIIISIFDVWKIELKLSGNCENGKNYSLKTTRKFDEKNNSFNLPLTKNLINTNTNNFLSLQRVRREELKIKTNAKAKFQ